MKLTMLRCGIPSASASACMALLSLSVNFHASAQPACVPAPSGLAAWWRAENNADEVIGGLTGTLFNGTTFVGGTVGQAFGFNGTNQYLEVADAPALTLTNELTIEFSVKRERPDGPNVDFVIEKGGDWTGGMQNYGVSLHHAGYNHCLLFLFDGGWRGGGSVADTNWHHCAAVARQGDADPTL